MRRNKIYHISRFMCAPYRVVRIEPVCCEPRHRRVSTLKVDILNVTYDCYSQNNNVKMTTL